MKDLFVTIRLDTNWLIKLGKYSLADRIDVSKVRPGKLKVAKSDYTIGVWYFTAWEPEYAWDSWSTI